MRILLIQARNPNDIAKVEEVQCFARQISCEVSSIESLNIATDNFSVDRCLGYDAIVIGGAGEFSVLDDDPRVRNFISVIGELTNGKQPLFASCFGFQALVLALGGQVIKDIPNAEVGTYELFKTNNALNDPIFSTFPETFLAQLGHQDRATKITDDLNHLAGSQRSLYQAVSFKDKPIYATQFHPELRDVDNALRFSRYMEIYGKLFGEAEAQSRMDSHTPSPEANTILNRFFNLFVR